MNRTRDDFPLLAARPGLVYLDSAATSQKPRAVLDAVREFYETDNANPHRGAYALSVAATERYHAAREKVAHFFGVADPDRLIFTRGTTESLNLVAATWGRTNLARGDEVIVTRLEHHANFVPWQVIAAERNATFRIAEITDDGRLDLDHLRHLVTPRTKVVAITHVSNALGTIVPLPDVIDIVRRQAAPGAIIVVDGAQSAPHLSVALDALDIDFYAFSGHKMLGPTGIGGLIGRRDLLEAMPPYQTGGDMIEFVGDERTTWNVIPHKFEAGTPNTGDAAGLAAAVDYLSSMGMPTVRRHEQALTAVASERLAAIPGVRVFGPPPAERSGVVSFTVADVHPHDLATILDQDGVCVRAGQHCAQPLLRRLGVGATARASFYVYNDAADVEALVTGVRKAQAMFADVAS
ncbi:MAG TPA: SufS family cysteine desulfurase [Gemmatimonadaceae bacterium]|jgi:cysteine desulfurase/selenocysteine lyase|nr:SufS family cysteine desulfurase [Gemmatimonadaceae bacterium]